MKQTRFFFLILLSSLMLLNLSCLRGSHMAMEQSIQDQEQAQKQVSSDRTDRSRPPLAIPPLLDTAKGIVELQAQRATHEILPNVPSPSMGYNGSFLGPTILLHKGKEAQIKVINDLGEDTTFHSHGAIIPGHADGGPQKIIADKSSWMLQFLVKQQAATLWYHPHKMGSTASQVWQGLAGLYIVSDPEIEKLPIPQDYGIDDIPLIIQERVLDRNGRMLPYSQIEGHMTTMHGASGNSLLVNGQLQPQLQAASGWLRLRLLNGSNASSYRFRFESSSSQPLSFYQIASEQGLLAKPEKLQFIDISTGSRAEIMLKLPEQAAQIDLNLSLWNGNLTAVEGESYPIVRIQVDPTRHSKGQLPEVLRSDAKLEAVERLGLELQQLLASGTTSPQVSQLPSRNLAMQMTHNNRMMMSSAGYGVNGKSFDMKTINFDVPKGRYELWNFRTDMLGHPVHIHGVQFLILKSAWLPNGSRSWRDTFTLTTGETASILLRFSENAGPDDPYMLHCHMLEHEEAGMMAQFTVS